MGLKTQLSGRSLTIAFSVLLSLLAMHTQAHTHTQDLCIVLRLGWGNSLKVHLYSLLKYVTVLMNQLF